jgi:hypothetical protein
MTYETSKHCWKALSYMRDILDLVPCQKTPNATRQTYGMKILRELGFSTYATLSLDISSKRYNSRDGVRWVTTSARSLQLNIFQRIGWAA